MKVQLKKIIEQEGLEILNEPERLAQLMAAEGCGDKDILSLVMVLKCCPSVSALLNRGDLCSAEVNTLVRAAVSGTGLTVNTVRDIMSALLGACDYESGWMPHLLLHEQKVTAEILPLVMDESWTVDQLLEKLESDKVRGDAIHDLDKLSQSGNVKASYALGRFYKTVDDMYDTQIGKVYFERAERMGYGPAKGALADYMVRGDHKNMTRVANNFENPTTLAGADGREWTSLSSKIQKYRQENAVRTRMSLTMQIIVLLLTGITLALTTTGFGAWAIVSLAVQALGLGWTVFCKLFRPFHTCRYAHCAMALGWLASMLAVF